LKIIKSVKAPLSIQEVYKKDTKTGKKKEDGVKVHGSYSLSKDASREEESPCLIKCPSHASLGDVGHFNRKEKTPAKPKYRRKPKHANKTSPKNPETITSQQWSSCFAPTRTRTPDIIFNCAL
jgi:hypothetical protein